MGYLGLLVGSLIGGYLIYSILQWAVFKRVTSNRLRSHVFAALAAYPVCAILYGFGAADSGEFRFDGLVTYLMPSLIILALAFKRGRDEERKSSADAQSAAF